MIAADGVTHAFGRAEVLRDAAVSAGPGEVVGLIGPNGSGKTTLLRTLYRALKPDRGEVLLDGRPVSEMRTRDVARAVAVVVQEPAGEFPLSVTDSVLLGRNPHLGTSQRHSAHDIAIAAEALRRVGAEHLAGRNIGELSGGERQRVLIACALAQQASHLLMDEPTNHLDIHFQHEVLQLVRGLEVSTIIVLHDLNLAARYCDHVVLLYRGRVVASGPTDQVLVPEILEPVYGIHIQPVRADDGVLQLLFRSPRHTDGTETSDARGVQTHTHR